MGVELSGDMDLTRRVEARRLAANCRARARVRCKRCRQAIPESRRRDSLYCSAACHANHRREQATALRTEMRAEFRRLVAPAACACGMPLDNRPGRHGKIAKSCKRCRDRLAMRQWYAKTRQGEKDCTPLAVTEGGG